jgi:hypothetical protein
MIGVKPFLETLADDTAEGARRVIGQPEQREETDK